MNNELRDFCISCGVPRNQGSTCEYCGRLYTDVPESQQQSPRHNALSTKYKIKKDQFGTVISWSWNRRSGLILMAFAILWMSITFPMISEVFADPMSTIPVPMLHLVVGVVLFLLGLIRFINNTSIHASEQSLYIRNHPLPLGRKVKVSTSNIEQIYVSRKRHKDKETSWHAPVLQLITKDGQRHEILKSAREAEFIDYESLRYIILNALNIQPESVIGEYSSNNTG